MAVDPPAKEKTVHQYAVDGVSMTLTIPVGAAPYVELKTSQCPDPIKFDPYVLIAIGEFLKQFGG